MLDYTVVIGRNQNFAGSTVKINALEITLYKSEELDFGVLTIPATTRFENFQILDRVDITVTDGETTKVYDPFLVISDEVEPVSKLGYYKHTITFIEDIHKFDKILSSNIFITQPLEGERNTLLDVLNHIRDVVPFERASVHSATRLFEIDQELADFLDDIDAPQFFFTGMNLREMINAVASYVNAIGRLEEGNNLVFSFYNEILNLIPDVNVDIIHRRLMNETKYNTSSIESSIENATTADDTERATIVYPSESDFINFRSSDLKITDTTYEYRLPYPIERITKVLYKTRLAKAYYFEVTNFSNLGTLDSNPAWTNTGPAGRVRENTLFKVTSTNEYYIFNDTGTTVIRNGTSYSNNTFIKIVPINLVFIEIPELESDSPHYFEEFDVTSHVYEINNYRRLPFEAPVGNVNIQKTADYQANTLHYENKGKTLSNNRLSGLFDGTNAIESFYRRVCFKNGYSDAPLLPGFDEWEDQLFRISYVPYFGTRVRLNKDDIVDHPYNTQMSSNQGERIVSAERLVRNIYGLAQRLGQDEIQIKRYYTSLNEMFNLGDITEDNFVIASMQITFKLTHFVVNYLFTKNFNRFANRIVLNQEYRPFDIGLGSKTVDRNLLYNEYVEIDTVNRQNTSLVNNKGINTFLLNINPNPNTSLENSFNGYGPVSYATIRDSSMKDITSTQELYIKAIPFGEGNTLNFYWSIDGVEQIGEQILKGSYTKPADIFGINIPFIDDFNVPIYYNRVMTYTSVLSKLDEFELYLSNSLDDNQQRFDPSDLPVANVIGDSQYSIGNGDPFILKKDKSESISMNYQLSIVPSYNLASKVIVGKKLVTTNSLISKEIKKDLFLYTSTTEKYNSIENLYAKGIRQTNDFYYNLDIETTIGGSVILGTNSQDIVVKLTPIFPSSFNLSTLKSWGIGDIDGNLYLGVNVDELYSPSPLYFNFMNKRFRMSYTFDDVEISPTLAPINLSAITSTLTSITFSWEDNQEEVVYETGYSQITNPDESAIIDPVFVNFTPTEEKSITFTGLVTNATYILRVRVIKDEIPSAYATITWGTYQLPPKVENVNAETFNSSVLLQWTDVLRDNGYEIIYKEATSSVFTQQLISNRNSISRTISLPVNKLNVFKVRAFNFTGDGPFSDEVIGVVPSFTALGAVAISDSIIEVDWQQLPNVSGSQTNQSIGYELKTTESTIIESGTTTTFGGFTSIVDETQSFVVDSLIGKIVYTPAMQDINGNNYFTIADNSTNTIVIDGVFSGTTNDLIGKDYFVVDFIEEHTITTYPYTDTSVQITDLTVDTFYKFEIRPFYTYLNAEFGDTIYGPLFTYIEKTLPTIIIEDVTAPVISTRPGYPTQSAVGWTVFNPNDFEATLLVSIGDTNNANPNTEATTLASSGSTNLTATDLSTNTTKILSARFVVNDPPNEVYSTTVYNSQTTLPPSAPPVPTGLQINNVTSTGVEFQWTFVSEATNGYRFLIEEFDSTTSTWSQVATGVRGQFVVIADFNLLENETIYRVSVRSEGIDGGQPSAYCTPVQFTTLSGVPPRPTTLTLSQTSSSSLSASWTSVSSATSYDFQLASDSGFTNIISNQPNITGTSTTVSGLFPATYYGRVRSKNSFGDSDWRTASIAMTA